MALSMQQLRSGINPHELNQWAPRNGINRYDPALWGFAGTLKYVQPAEGRFQRQLSGLNRTLENVFKDMLEEQPWNTIPFNPVIQTFDTSTMTTLMLVLNPMAYLREGTVDGRTFYWGFNQKDRETSMDMTIVAALRLVCNAAMEQFQFIYEEQSAITYTGPAKPEFSAFTFQHNKEYNSDLTSDLTLIPCLRTTDGAYLLLGENGSLLKSDFSQFITDIRDITTNRSLPAMIDVWNLVHSYGTKRSPYLAQLPPYAFDMVMLMVLSRLLPISWEKLTFQQFFASGFDLLITISKNGTPLPSPYLNTVDLLTSFRDDADELREWFQTWRDVPEADLLQVLNGCITYR